MPAQCRRGLRQHAQRVAVLRQGRNWQQHRHACGAGRSGYEQTYRDLPVANSVGVFAHMGGKSINKQTLAKIQNDKSTSDFTA